MTCERRNACKMRNDSYQTANDSSHIENCPEPGEVSSLGSFMGVGDHNSALGSPQQTSTNTEKSTSEDVEAWNIGMLGCKQADSVNAVTNTTKGKGGLNTELVDESATEETEDREGAVDGRILRRS